MVRSIRRPQPRLSRSLSPHQKPIEECPLLLATKIELIRSAPDTKPHAVAKKYDMGNVVLSQNHDFEVFGSDGKKSLDREFNRRMIAQFQADLREEARTNGVLRLFLIDLVST